MFGGAYLSRDGRPAVVVYTNNGPIQGPSSADANFSARRHGSDATPAEAPIPRLISPSHLVVPSWERTPIVPAAQWERYQPRPTARFFSSCVLRGLLPWFLHWSQKWAAVSPIVVLGSALLAHVVGERREHLLHSTVAGSSRVSKTPDRRHRERSASDVLVGTLEKARGLVASSCLRVSPNSVPCP